MRQRKWRWLAGLALLGGFLSASLAAGNAPGQALAASSSATPVASAAGAAATRTSLATRARGVHPLVAHAVKLGHKPATDPLPVILVYAKGLHARGRQQVDAAMARQGFRLDRHLHQNIGARFIGTVGSAEQTFGVRINSYQTKGRTFFANDRAPTLPPALANRVSSIAGLHNATRLHPRLQPRTVLGPTGQPTPPYLPSQLKAFYGLNTLNASGFDGTGQKIGIVTFAYLNGAGGNDLSVDVQPFLNAFGLNSAASRFNFTVMTSAGLPLNDSNSESETILDLSWSAAMAPGAEIDVVEDSASDSFVNAIDTMITTYHPNVISISWGECETSVSQSLDEQPLDDYLSQLSPSIPIFVASGDKGSNDGCGLSADFPSVEPHVTSVGGTSIQPDVYGNPAVETGWNCGGSGCDPTYNGASGGGFSSYFSRPSWQTGLSSGFDSFGGCPSASCRAVPDVSLLADPQTGFAFHDGYWWPGGIGGTSAAAPSFAGLVATIDQALLAGGRPIVGFPNPTFYSNPSAFADVSPSPAVSNGDYITGPGWDPLTGLGSAQANSLLQAFGSAILPTPAPTPAPGNGSYDDAIPTTAVSTYPVSYSPSYDWMTGCSAGALNGTEHCASFAGDAVYFQFNGTSVTFIYSTNSDGGIADVSIDGGVPATLDQYSSSLANQQSTTWNSLPPGNHTLEMSVSGNTNAPGGGTMLYVDAFTVPGTAPTPTPTLTPTPGSTSTPTATIPPTTTLTPTPTPTPAPVCSPRPRVRVAAAPGSSGQLQVTITASGANNALVSLEFGAFTNALVDIGGRTGLTGNTTVALPAGTQQTTFTVRRATAGQATTVNLTVVDGCGSWPTFVGGGPGAF